MNNKQEKDDVTCTHETEKINSKQRDIVDMEGVSAYMASSIETINIQEKNLHIYEKIQKLYKTHSLLRAQIINVSPLLEDKETKEYTFYVTITIDNEIQGTIMESEFIMPSFKFSDAYYKLNEKGKAEYRCNNARRMIGAWIPILFTKVEREYLQTLENGQDFYQYHIEASRIQGMKHLQEKWYQGIDVLQEGDVTDAYVLYATESFICVEILGVETMISYRECSTAPIRDCRKFYHSGNVLRVKIGRIKNDETGIRVAASGRLYEMNNEKTKQKFEQIVNGGVYFGVVSHTSQKGHYIVNLTGYSGIVADINPNKVTGHIKLNRGDIVSVFCTHKIEDGMFILGTAEKK